MNTHRVFIYSGNVLANTIRNKGTESPTDELFESLKSCIVDTGNKDFKNACNKLDSNKVMELFPPTPTEFCADAVTNSHLHETSPVDQTTGVDRSELKVTLKIFTYSGTSVNGLENDPDNIITAIQKGLLRSSVSFADSIVISFAGKQDQPTINNMERLQNVWKKLEYAVKEGLVKMIGICDIDTGTFKELYKWAEVKPSIVQINLASCCVVPPELSGFCKENQIQLLTHSDAQDILPDNKIEELTREYHHKKSEVDDELPEQCSTTKTTTTIKWIIRYQVHLKCRGVLSNKGYVAALSF